MSSHGTATPIPSTAKIVARKFPALLALAKTPDSTQVERAAIRKALEDPMRQFAHEFTIVADIASGPDPEEAPPMLVDTLSRMRATLSAIDRELAVALATASTLAIHLGL